MAKEEYPKVELVFPKVQMRWCGEYCTISADNFGGEEKLTISLCCMHRFLTRGRQAATRSEYSSGFCLHGPIPESGNEVLVIAGVGVEPDFQGSMRLTRLQLLAVMQAILDSKEYKTRERRTQVA